MAERWPDAGDVAAVRAVDRLPAGPAEAARPVLHELVRQLNRIDARYDLIDTLRREQAGDAFLSLATRAGVPAAQAGEWFDEWRTF